MKKMLKVFALVLCLSLCVVGLVACASTEIKEADWESAVTLKDAKNYTVTQKIDGKETMVFVADGDKISSKSTNPNGDGFIETIANKEGEKYFSYTKGADNKWSKAEIEKETYDMGKAQVIGAFSLFKFADFEYKDSKYVVKEDKLSQGAEYYAFEFSNNQLVKVNIKMDSAGTKIEIVMEIKYTGSVTVPTVAA